MNNAKKADRKNIIGKTVNFEQAHLGLHLKLPIFILIRWYVQRFKKDICVKKMRGGEGEAEQN